MNQRDASQPKNINHNFVDALHECEQSNGHWSPLLDAKQVIDICYACCSTIRMIQSADIRAKQFKILRELLGVSYNDPRVRDWIADTCKTTPPP